MTGEKALPRSPLLLGGGVRGGGEKYGHNLFIISGLTLAKPCFIATTPDPSSPEEGTTWQGDSFILTHPPTIIPYLRVFVLSAMPLGMFGAVGTREGLPAVPPLA